MLKWSKVQGAEFVVPFSSHSFPLVFKLSWKVIRWHLFCSKIGIGNDVFTLKSCQIEFRIWYYNVCTGIFKGTQFECINITGFLRRPQKLMKSPVDLTLSKYILSFLALWKNLNFTRLQHKNITHCNSVQSPLNTGLLLIRLVMWA